MSLLNNFKILVGTIVLVVIVLIGCREPRGSIAEKGLFGLHLHAYIDTNLVLTGQGANEYSQEFQDHYKRWMNITTANVYITNVGLHSQTSGNWYTIPGSILMKRLEQELYIIDSVPTDTYDNVRFTVGLGSAFDSISRLNISPASPDSVLASPLMYAGAGKGYYIMYLAGNIDTSSGHQLINPIPFTYQIAGDTMVVSPPAASGGNTFSIIPASQFQGPQLIHIILDYGKLLESFPITVPTNVNTFTTPALAAPVLDSIPGMFRYECSVPTKDC